jgi:hypothetical protein
LRKPKKADRTIRKKKRVENLETPLIRTGRTYKGVSSCKSSIIVWKSTRRGGYLDEL